MGMAKTWAISAMTLMVLAACGGGTSADANKTAPTAPPVAGSEAVASSAPASNLPATAELKIYNWSDYVDPDTVKDFEKNQGVKVIYDVYDSNETLEAKVLTGQSGYDVVTPSNTYIGRQIKSGAYQKLDKTLLPNLSHVDPKLMVFLKEVDPTGEYSIPYFWGMNTMGINVDKVTQALGGEPLPDNEWDLLFKPEYTHKLKSCGISVLDSVSDVFPLALNYLGKNPHSQTTEDLQAAADLIKTVRPDIRRFSSSGYIDDLARGDLCLTLGYGGDLNIAARRATEAKNKVKIEVLVPKTGFGVWMDAFLIPRDASNVLNAHKYVNDTLDPAVAAKNGNYVTYAPASKAAKDLMEKEYTENRSIFPNDEDLEKGFMYLPMEADALKTATRMWQDIKKGG